MTQTEFLRDIVERLEQAGVPCMLSGSFASSVYGEPRSTNDIDLVIDPTRDQLDAFVSSFNPSYYVSPSAVEQAWAHRSMFNVIQINTGWKTDLILKKRRPFSECEFERRQERDLFGRVMSIVSPEDSILSKLEWAAKSGSDRQLRDAASMLRANADSLDGNYLKHWAAELGVEGLLAEVQAGVRSSTP